MSERTKPTPGPWRVGRKVFRTIYGQVDGVERLIGVMDRPEDATLAAASTEMLDVLREVEWGCSQGMARRCPSCGGVMGEGDHTPGCRLAAVLARAEGRAPDTAPARGG